jgi:hypothetical protein
MNDIEARRQRMTIEDIVAGVKCEPARPSFIAPGDGLWHAYCLGFDAGVKKALEQVRMKVAGTS